MIKSRQSTNDINVKEFTKHILRRSVIQIFQEIILWAGTLFLSTILIIYELSPYMDKWLIFAIYTWAAMCLTLLRTLYRLR